MEIGELGIKNPKVGAEGAHEPMKATHKSDSGVADIRKGSAASVSSPELFYGSSFVDVSREQLCTVISDSMYTTR